MYTKTSLSVLLTLSLSLTATAADKVQLLKAYGYLPNVKLQDLERATLTDAHQVEGLEERFCGHPDFADQEIANSKADELSHQLDIPEDHCHALIQCHRRYMEATGRGSWPAKCYPQQYPDNHATKYYVDKQSFPSHFHQPVSDEDLQDLVRAKVWGVTLPQAKAKWGGEEMLNVALMLADESYRRVGCAHIQTDEHEGANIHVRSLGIPGSTIGIAWFNNGTCGDHVEHRIDSGYRPNLRRLAGLITHEFGHNHNLPHTFSGQNTHYGIMSYNQKSPFVGYSTGKALYDRPKDPSWPQLVRQYGGEAVPTDDPTPPPPPDGKIVIKPGDVITLTLSGARVSMRVETIDTDEGPSLAKRVADAVTRIPDYPAKDRHRQMLVMIYTAVSQAVEENQITIQEATTAVSALRNLLLTADAPKWKEVFDLADGVQTVAGLQAVSAGLLGNEALPPEIVAVINLIVQLLPDGPLKTIVQIILAIIDGLETKNAPLEGTEVSVAPMQYQQYTRNHNHPFCIAC